AESAGKEWGMIAHKLAVPFRRTAGQPARERGHGVFGSRLGAQEHGEREKADHHDGITIIRPVLMSTERRLWGGGGAFWCDAPRKPLIRPDWSTSPLRGRKVNLTRGSSPAAGVQSDCPA